MSDEIVRQKSDPMKEQFNSERFSFLPSVKHSRGHRFHSSNSEQDRSNPCLFSKWERKMLGG